MPPSRLPNMRLPILITRRMRRRPLPQRIPIPTHARLVGAHVAVAGGGQDCGIGRAHDVLAEGVEAVEVVLHGAVEGLVVQEVEVVAADGFLFFFSLGQSVFVCWGVELTFV